LLNLMGVPVETFTPGHRFAARLLFDGLSPFALLILVSLFTRPPPREKLDQFFGKMKTPVAADAESDASEMAATAKDPHRFDHLKLFPHSNWEFTRWNRADAVGFLSCLVRSGTIVFIFWGLLQLAAT